MSDNRIIESKILTYDISYHKGSGIPMGKCFTKVAPRYHKDYGVCSYLKKQGKPTPQDGIFGYYTIEEFIAFANGLAEGTPKHEHAFLKGIFSGGTTMVDIVETSDYLPIDIDFKDNKWMRDVSKVSDVIYSLKRHTAFMGRSASGRGIWGMLLVDGLGELCKEGFNEDEKAEHKRIANMVYRMLEKLVEKDTGIKISLDDSQGAFRHIRYAAHQRKPIELNYEPTVFTFERKETVKTLPNTNGIVRLKRERDNFSGTVYEQFNRDNSIWDLCDTVGLRRVGNGNRLLRDGGTGSTGEVKDNGAYFICNSSTFANSHGCSPLIGYSYYYPHHFYMIAKGFQSYKELERDLLKQGYSHSELDFRDMYDTAAKATSNRTIFKLCETLFHRDVESRYKFFYEAPIPEHLKPIYRGYLNIKPLKIEFDEEYPLEGFVSTRLEQIFDIVDAKGMVALNSPTGSGKTYSIIDDFPKIRPNKRALIIESLTAPTEQAGQKSNADIVRLFGSELTIEDFDKSKENDLTIGTYNQSIRVLTNRINPFDYIIIDELHSFVLGNSYRYKVLKPLTKALEKYMELFPETKILGLTGTSISLFKDLGFYMVNLYRENPPVIKVIQRVDGRTSDVKIRQHQIDNVTKGDKVMYRADSAAIMGDLRDWYIDNLRYKENEVIYFTGEKEIKSGKDYRGLVKSSRFDDSVKVVLTSPLLDEGVSIDNEDFNQLVFMDNKINWRPEVFKQLTARFRQPEDLTIYQYIKERKEQVYRNETASYDEVEREILEFMEEDGVETTTFRVLGSLNRYKHEDGSLYNVGIAYKTSEDFFDSLTTDERNLFMKLNYNVQVEKDLEYEKQKIKPVKKNMPRKERDALKTQFLDENWQEVLAVFCSHAKNPEDKDSVLRLGEGLLPFVDNEQVRSFVWNNYEYFKTVIETYAIFTQVSFEPYSLLFDKDGTAASKASLERRANFFKVQYMLRDLGNSKGDRKLAAKYMRVLKDVDSHKGHLSMSKVLRLAKKARIPEVKSTLVWKNRFKDIISANTSKVWDKDRHFVEKEGYPIAVKRYMTDWLRPFNEDEIEEQEYKYKPQITEQLKLNL